MSNPHPLRPTRTRKGVKNRVSSDLKGLILQALERSGGCTWLQKLAEEQPGHFTKLLAMLVPREISHSGILTGVSVVINSNISSLGAGFSARTIEAQEPQMIPPHAEDPDDSKD